MILFRICQNQAKSARIMPNQAESGRIRQNHAKSGRIRQNQSKSIRIMQNLSESTQIRQNHAESVRIRPNHAESGRIRPCFSFRDLFCISARSTFLIQRVGGYLSSLPECAILRFVFAVSPEFAISRFVFTQLFELHRAQCSFCLSRVLHLPLRLSFSAMLAKKRRSSDMEIQSEHSPYEIQSSDYDPSMCSADENDEDQPQDVALL